MGKRIRQIAGALIASSVVWMSQVASPYGDGQAARRTVEALLHEFRGVGSRPLEFLAETVGA